MVELMYRDYYSETKAANEGVPAVQTNWAVQKQNLLDRPLASVFINRVPTEQLNGAPAGTGVTGRLQQTVSVLKTAVLGPARRVSF